MQCYLWNKNKKMTFVEFDPGHVTYPALELLVPVFLRLSYCPLVEAWIPDGTAHWLVMQLKNSYFTNVLIKLM